MKKIIFIIIVILSFVYLNRPITTNENYPKIEVSTKNLKNTVSLLVNTSKPRTFINVDTLNESGKDLANLFKQYNYEVVEQKYIVENKEYKNIIASYGDKNAPRFVVGAHYDVAAPFDKAGADDNASGVAGLMELARLFNKYKPNINYRIDFVAYTLEEPPIFNTNQMGSYIHAKHLKENNINVLGMASLEMIGYYSDEENSQRFPFPLSVMSFLYPDKGNFIAVASNFSSNHLRLQMKKSLKETDMPTETLLFPDLDSGFMGLSDHKSYWKHDFPALLVTDTSFFRNDNYHTPYDTIDTLNFEKMSEVVKGTYWFLINFK